MYSCIFFGENSQKAISDITTLSSEILNVLSFNKNKILVCGAYPHIALINGENNINIEGENIILIFTDKNKYNIKIKNCVGVVSTASDSYGARFASDHKFLLIDCGMSPKSTLTFSSMGDDLDIVCLQRTITLSDNSVIEPMEQQLHKKIKNPINELIFSAINIIINKSCT